MFNISCIFSVCAFILFPRSWIIFAIIILNSFSGRLPISTSLSCPSGALPYSFIWNIFLCHVILFNFLCLRFPFHRLQDCSSPCSGVCLLVGEVGSGASAVFLVGGTGSCPLVGGAGSCPSAGQGHVKGCV